MMPDNCTLKSQRSRVTSICLVYDIVQRALVATPQGLLVVHRRRDDRLHNLYLVCVPSSLPASDVQTYLKNLQEAVAAICG